MPPQASRRATHFRSLLIYGPASTNKMNRFIWHRLVWGLKTEDETLGLGICCRHFTGDGTRSCVHTTVIEFICTVQQREGLKVFQFLLSIYSTIFSEYVCPKHHFEHRCPTCDVCLLSCVEIKPFRGWIMFYSHCLWIVTKLRVYVASWILSFLPSPHFQTLMFNTSSVQCQPPK